MTPDLPSELIAGSWELVCCACTAVAALFGYLFALR
jgi:hypothetical protein